MFKYEKLAQDLCNSLYRGFGASFQGKRLQTEFKILGEMYTPRGVLVSIQVRATDTICEVSLYNMRRELVYSKNIAESAQKETHLVNFIQRYMARN